MEEASPWLSGELKDWSVLVGDAVPSTVRKNEILYSQEDEAKKIYIVESGRICVTSYQMDGGEKQIFIAEQGALFGEDACLMGLPCLATAVAIVDSAVYNIPFAKVKEAMKNDWDLSLKVMQMLCRKNLILLQQVRELSSSAAVQRVAKVLVNLSRQYGKVEDGDVCIGIRFTHQDVANLIKASRVTVSNVFQTFMADGILEKRSGRFWIKDMGRLLSVSGDE